MGLIHNIKFILYVLDKNPPLAQGTENLKETAFDLSLTFPIYTSDPFIKARLTFRSSVSFSRFYGYDVFFFFKYLIAKRKNIHIYTYHMNNNSLSIYNG